MALTRVYIRKHSLEEISAAKHHILWYIFFAIFIPHYNQPPNQSVFEIYHPVVHENNVVAIPHIFFALLSMSKLSASSPIHLSSQSISLHFHSYHPNISHVFSYLVYSNTTLTTSSAPLWFCNNPFSLLQLKLSFWVATWITWPLSMSYFP